MPARKIMIIRHAEKPTTSPAVEGVDPSGQQSAEDLIVQGWQRAGALARFFNPYGQPLSPGLSLPSLLFASAVGKHSHSLRPLHTLLPLADLLNIQIDLSYTKEQAAEMAAAVAQLTEPVLVAWEHQDIPSIVNAIAGNTSSCPQNWPGDRFDLVWVLDQEGDGMPWRFTQVPQMLLAGDVPTPISA